MFLNCFTLNYVNSSVRFWERKNILMTLKVFKGWWKFFFYFLFITLLFLIVFYCCCVFLHRWLCVMKNALRVLRTAWRLVRTTFCFENWEKLSKVKSFNLVFIKQISHHLKKNNFKILVAINITWFKAGQFNFQKNLLKLAR